LRVGNDLAGFLQELSRHNAQGVDGAGGLRRELENRRGAGRNGTRKKTRAEHRDERNGECGKLTGLVNRFFPRTGIHRGLADVFDVTGNSVIGDVTQAVERPVIMPAGIAITVKRFGNNCSDHIRVTVHGKVCARSIKRGH